MAIDKPSERNRSGKEAVYYSSVIRSRNGIFPYFVLKVYPFFESDLSSLNLERSAFRSGISFLGSRLIAFNSYINYLPESNIELGVGTEGIELT